MNQSSLRNQLSDAKHSPTGPAGAAASAGREAIQAFTAADNSLGITFLEAEPSAISFPYSHYIFCELTEKDVLVVRFATHRVLIKGSGLMTLMEELRMQRLATVRALPKRLKEQADSATVWIEKIHTYATEIEPSKEAEPS